ANLTHQCPSRVKLGMVSKRPYVSFHQLRTCHHKVVGPGSANCGHGVTKCLQPPCAESGCEQLQQVRSRAAGYCQICIGLEKSVECDGTSSCACTSPVSM